MRPSARTVTPMLSRQVDELKERLQLVVAIRAASGDVQKEIELCGRGPERLDRRFLRRRPRRAHEPQ